MKNLFCLLCIICYLMACSKTKQGSEYPVIDVVGSVGNYQKVYCSELFLSIELIPLETTDECLLAVPNRPGIIMNEDFIVIAYTFFHNFQLYSFDRTGKFLNKIGQKGQGPGDYIGISKFFFKNNTTVFVSEIGEKILEYELHGKFIRSIRKPNIEGQKLHFISYVSDNMFIGSLPNYGKNKHNHFLFDDKGNIVKSFPNHFFFNREGKWMSSFDGGLEPFGIDERLYLKNYVNDTLYCLENSVMQPAFVFGLGKYTFDKESIVSEHGNATVERSLIISYLMGTPKYLFYEVLIPEILPRPKVNPVFSQRLNKLVTWNSSAYGIYNMEENVNMLLEGNENISAEKGIINDINGGLPFFPRYYAGNNVVVDMWDAEIMKTRLTDEYFATRTIKDPQSHQKLKALLEILKEDDNPIIVVAKLK